MEMKKLNDKELQNVSGGMFEGSSDNSEGVIDKGTLFNMRPAGMTPFEKTVFYFDRDDVIGDPSSK